MEKSANVLVVDDHPLFRAALELALIRAKIAADNVQSCNCIKDALSHIKKTKYDLVLLDLNLSDSQGFEGFAKIRSANENLPVIVISATEKTSAYTTAKSLGAAGYIPKSSALETITSAIQNVLNGGTSFPDNLPNTTNVNAADKLASLTPAQNRVMNCLSNGLLNKQIAFEMSISEATVKAHMTAIFRKLGANNRTQALLVFRKAIQV